MDIGEEYDLALEGLRGIAAAAPGYNAGSQPLKLWGKRRQFKAGRTAIEILLQFIAKFGKVEIKTMDDMHRKMHSTWIDRGIE